MKELGELIREARQGASLSGDSLVALIEKKTGNKSKLTADKISRIETAARKETPPPLELFEISEALGVSQPRMLAALGYDMSRQLVGDLGPYDRRQKIRELAIQLPDEPRLDGMISMMRDWIREYAALASAASDTK